MIMRLFVALLLGMFLSACESTQQKRDEVVVEDMGTSLEDGTGAAEDDTGVQTYGAVDDELSGMSALDDPDSPLSTRIIYFDYDSSDILPEYRGIVEAHASFLTENPDISITLEGHADERGSREYNLALGERRAESIKRQMTLLGVSPSQIITVSYGEERPQVDGHDDYAWSQNRRVEILY